MILFRLEPVLQLHASLTRTDLDAYTSRHVQYSFRTIVNSQPRNHHELVPADARFRQHAGAVGQDPVDRHMYLQWMAVALSCSNRR